MALEALPLKTVPALIPNRFHWEGARLGPLALCVLVGAAIWLIPAPEGVKPAAWHLLAIFVATIVGLITKPLPMGAVAMIGIVMTAVTGTLPVADALSGFSNTTIWLIVAAFFISRGFIKTGLGARIAYLFVAVLGKKTLGLAYGLAATDLVLSPAIPSNTARTAGVVFPVMRSISTTFGSEPDKTAGKMGAFLTITAYQTTIITSAMFLTSSAQNPLAAQFAAQQGITIAWLDWARMAIVPGLVSLLVVPWVLFKLFPPEIKETPEAAALARTKLGEMGGVTRSEWTMLGVFVMLLSLWIFGPTLLGGLDATSAALVGLAVLLLLSVLTWDDVKKEEGAWDTLVWFAALVMMADFLNKLGLIAWFTQSVGGNLTGLPWVPAFIVLALVYFYSHYLFASNTAHVSAMYAAFLTLAIAVGTPVMLAALVLAVFSSLFSSMTHYGTGPAPILFGAGYVSIGTWWKLGALVSVINIVIWVGIGGIWWKILGLW